MRGDRGQEGSILSCLGTSSDHRLRGGDCVLVGVSCRSLMPCSVCGLEQVGEPRLEHDWLCDRPFPPLLPLTLCTYTHTDRETYSYSSLKLTKPPAQTSGSATQLLHPGRTPSCLHFLTARANRGPLQLRLSTVQALSVLRTSSTSVLSHSHGDQGGAACLDRPVCNPQNHTQ